MKKYFALVLLIFINEISLGQTPIPSFGKLTPEEVDLKECAFDKTAEAVVIFDQAVTNYDDSYSLVTERRIKIKILKESGVDRGNINIRYYSHEGFEFIKNLDAVVNTPNADETSFVETKLDKRSVYTKQLSKYYSVVSFALPNVKKGSIIEYVYTSVKKDYGGLRNWHFQSDIPVMLSSYLLYVMPNVTFAYTARIKSYFRISITSPAPGSTLFEMRNIPGLRDEAYSPNEKDYLQRVDFQFAGHYTRSGYFQNSSTTWQEFNKDFLEEKEFGGQLNKKIGEDFLKANSITALSTEDKIRLVYDHVRNNITWDEYYSIYCLTPVKTVWEKKKGNSAEVNFVMINLLRAAGIDAYPILVSERSNGRVDTTYPFKTQFNTVMTLVMAEGKTYIMDGKDKLTPYFMIPYDALNTIGFLVDKKTSGFVTIQSSSKYEKNIALEADVKSSGTIYLTAYEKFKNYGRLENTYNYRLSSNTYESNLKNKFSFMKIDSVTVLGAESDTGYLDNIIKGSYEAEQSGDYYLLHYNMFLNFKTNPFTTENRFTKIDFGYRSVYNLEAIFHLPENMTIESVPKDAREANRDNSMVLTRRFIKSGNMVKVKVSIELNRAEFYSEEYSMVKSFFTKMIDMLGEPIVLKTK